MASGASAIGLGCLDCAWCTPPVGPSLLGAAVEVRTTVVAHGRAGRLLEPRPRGLGVWEGGRAGMCPHGVTERSVHCSQEAAGGLVERESSVLPGRMLTESRQPLHVTPERAGIRLVLLRQCVRLRGLLAR